MEEDGGGVAVGPRIKRDGCCLGRRHKEIANLSTLGGMGRRRRRKKKKKTTSLAVSLTERNERPLQQQQEEKPRRLRQITLIPGEILPPSLHNNKYHSHSSLSPSLSFQAAQKRHDSQSERKKERNGRSSI